MKENTTNENMLNIKEISEDSIQCPSCLINSTILEWDMLNKELYEDGDINIIKEVRDNSYRSLAYCCPKCNKEFMGYRFDSEALKNIDTEMTLRMYTDSKNWRFLNKVKHPDKYIEWMKNGGKTLTFIKLEEEGLDHDLAMQMEKLSIIMHKWDKWG